MEEKLVTAAPGVERLPEPLPAIIAEILKRLSNVEATVAELEEGVAMPAKIEQLPFTRTLAPLEGRVIADYAPFLGYIKRVLIDWPEGCDHLVDVRVGHGTQQFCPKEGYLALNRATPSWEFNELMEDHEEIWVDMNNGDGLNPHHITVTVFVKEAS